jgi:non-ribosomal peptide synthetase component F
LSNPDVPLSGLTFLTGAERQQVLTKWSGARSVSPRSASITRLFEEQVAQSPQAIAILFEDHSLTFRELNARANQLAHYLRSMGVGPETTVGLCLERSLELVVALVGILKAGGAYVPLDPSYPEEHLHFMVRDSRLALLISQEKFAGLLPFERAQTILLDQHGPLIARESERNLEVNVDAENLAYLIYTSGSTGRTKGVSIPHRAVVRLVRQTNYIEFGPKQVFLQLAPISFDASTFEIWGSLLNGGRLVVMPPQSASLEEIGRTIRLHGVTTLWLTAGLFQQMVDYRLEDLQSVRPEAMSCLCGMC